MLKKNVILLSILMLCLVISGCNDGISTELSGGTSTKLIKELPTKEVIEDTDSPPDYVLLDEDIESYLEGYCKKYTYLDFSQKMTSYSLIKGKKQDEKIVADINIKVDLKNRLTLSKIVSSITDDRNTNYYFADDNRNKIYLSKIDDGKYIHDKDAKPSIHINYKDIKDTFSFINFISDDLFPKLGTIGTYKDGEYTFTTLRNATESDISDIEYDKLEQTKVVLVLKEGNGNKLIPKSLSMDTTFTVGSIKYGVSTICEFNKFSNDTLELPKYVKIGKIKSSTKKFK